MTLIVLLRPDVSYCISMFAHSIPAHQRGSVRFLGVALFLPSYPLSSFGVVPGSCVSSIIPSSWNIGICGHGPRLTDGCSAREMEPVHRAREQTQTALGDLVNHGHRFGLPSQREPFWLNQIPIGFRFHLFF